MIDLPLHQHFYRIVLQMTDNKAIVMSDKELIEEISQKKDEGAFTIFYNKYYRLLYEWAFRKTSDVELANEITQYFLLYPSLCPALSDWCIKFYLCPYFNI